MRSGILLLVIVCCLTAEIECRRSFVIHLKNTECAANPDFVNLTECSIKEVNSVPTIFLNAVLMKELRNFTYGMKIIVHRDQGDLVMFNAKEMDGCAFLSDAVNIPFLKIIHKEFGKYSNLPKKCPVKKGTSINVHGLRVDPENFPTYVPETKFSSIGYTRTDTTTIFNINVTGICEARRKFFNISIFKKNGSMA